MTSYCFMLPQCAMLFYVIGWYPMYCMFIANFHVVSYDVYINSQMVFIMFNDKLMGLLMIIIEYLMIFLISMKLIVLNSLHWDCYMLYGDEWRWIGYLPCAVMWCMLFMDVFMWINAVFNVIQWFLSVTLINPHNPIYCKLLRYLIAPYVVNYFDIWYPYFDTLIQ